jgi:glycosyltransferase involved in cell wall biosynthesis
MINFTSPRSLTLVLPCPALSDVAAQAPFAMQLELMARQAIISRILVLHSSISPPILKANGRASEKVRFMQMDSWFSGTGVARLLETTDSDLVVVMPAEQDIEIEERSFERFLGVAETTGAGLVYSDSRDFRGGQFVENARLDYQPGSIRETFDFGPVIYLSRTAIKHALVKHGPIDPSLRWAGLYDLRLKLSIDFPLVRIPESLYLKRATPLRSSNNSAFTIQAHRDYQLEMERVANAHLRHIGAYLEPGLAPPPCSAGEFPVIASVIIPVRNREQTITDAVASAVAQSTTFPYNVIVVNHHSTDRTTQLLQQLTQRHKNLIYKTPKRRDLGIGGLWNEAIYSPECGLYAVQLDSDDVYSNADSLERIIAKFVAPSEGHSTATKTAPRYAMVIGSHTLVDFALQETSSGLRDHPLLSEENGQNNLLRLEGPGAPRAFYVPVLRRFGFPNISYGEDYAVALRLSREYRIGRIFESLYLARKWEGNTEGTMPLGSLQSVDIKKLLPPGVVNYAQFLERLQPIVEPLVNASRSRYTAYKDWLRTLEIQARKDRNAQVVT